MKIKIAFIFLSFFIITNSILFSFDINVNIFNQLIHFVLFFLFLPKDLNFLEKQLKLFDSEYLHRFIIITFFVIIIVSIVFIIALKGLNFKSFINRSRDFREDLFSSNIPFYIRYFILFSSSILPFFLGFITSITRKKSLIIFGVIAFFLLDGITDSRSSILAFIIGLLSSFILFRKINIKSLSIIFFGLCLTFFFILYGQGFDSEIFALRGLSYFTVPPLISNVLYENNESLFLGSFLEIFAWPIYSIFSFYPFNTNYEFEFIQLETGLPGNVLIPIYACYNNILDSILILILFFINNIIRNVFFKNLTIIGFIVYFTVFGPMSLLLNPFLAEKGLFVFILFIIIFINYLKKYKIKL